VSPFRVAFVCTGNRFRSPLAERVLRQRVDDLPVEIESLGTLQLGPLEALPEAIREADRMGIDLTDHRARSLAGADLSDTDLVLGFERAHVVTAVVDAKASRDHTFTLPELVALLDRVDAPQDLTPADRARSLVRRAAAHRPPDPQLRSVPELSDPLGRRRDEQRGIALEVEELVGRLADVLFKAET
jgi:protein-tyrosine phosphatase